MTTFSVGAAVGPLVGGALVEAFWWGAVFLIGVPAMALLLVTGPWLLPEERAADAGRPDPASVLLALLSTLPVVYAVKQVATHGPEPLALLAAAVGVLAGVLFVRRQRRLADPMLDVTLFTRPAFTSAVLLLLIAVLAVNALMFLLPQYLQLVAGQPVLVAGLWMLPVAGVTVLGSLAAPALSRAIGVPALVAVAAGLAAVGSLLLGLVGADHGPVAVAALTAMAVLGLSPIGVLGTDLVVGSVPARRAGSAAAVSETAGELGVALGVAVTGSVLAAVYGSRLAVPADVAERTREGLAGAVASAAGLPERLAADLLASARSAFVAGFAVVGLVAAGLLAVVVVLALTAMRRGGDGG